MSLGLSCDSLVDCLSFGLIRDCEGIGKRRESEKEGEDGEDRI